MPRHRRDIFLCTSVVLQLFETLGTDILVLVHHQVSAAVTENTAGTILFQYDGGAIYINLQSILLSDIQCAAQFDGQNDPSQFVHLSHNSG